MATIIWCDRVRHIVEEPRTQVADLIEHALGECDPFVFFTPADGGSQRALNVHLISSFEAMPGDGI